MDFLRQLVATAPRPGLHPIPGTTPLTLEAMLCPPLLYYLALLFLPPPPPPTVDTKALTFLRNAIALLAALLFFRLPLAYHVPQSIGLTYQLGLVGVYGGARVLDAFFISPYLFGHIPRRVVYKHESRVSTPVVEGFRDVKPKESSASKPTDGDIRTVARNTSGNCTERPEEIPSSSATDLLDNVSLSSLDNSFSLLHRSLVAGPRPKPVLEHAISEDGWPHCFTDRASWALELELSMRGVGFTWSTADVRHTRKTWLPTVHNRLHSILIHATPTLLVSLAVVRSIYLRYELGDVEQALWDGWSQRRSDSISQGEEEDLFDTRLPFPVQLLLTGCLGAVLMAAFSLAHSAFAILCSPLAPSPLAYFPPLYSVRIWAVRSVRGFWSYGWHRLFARFFLVYGVWPCEWIERTLLGKADHEPADIGKVMGAFLSSGFCHSFAVRGVSGGDWWLAKGEAVFFALNGVAVVVEEVVKRVVVGWRKKSSGTLERWYDGYVGRIWWISVLLLSGRSFARGWVNAGLVKEMSAM